MPRNTPPIARKRDLLPAILGSIPQNVTVITGAADGEFSVTWDDDPDPGYEGTTFGMAWQDAGGPSTFVLIPYVKGTTITGAVPGGTVEVRTARIYQNDAIGPITPTVSGTAGTT